MYEWLPSSENQFKIFGPEKSTEPKYGIQAVK